MEAREAGWHKHQAHVLEGGPGHCVLLSSPLLSSVLTQINLCLHLSALVRELLSMYTQTYVRQSLLDLPACNYDCLVP